MDIKIENVIGYDITSSDFAQMLSSASKKKESVNLRINSVGGNTFDGLKMMTDIMIAQQDGTQVNTFNDGLAASMASLIAAIGTKRFTQEHATFMIHNPQTFAFGDDDDMMSAAQAARIIKERGAAMYARASGLEESKVLEMMKKTTFLDSKQQVEMGFADQILIGSKPVARMSASKIKKNIAITNEIRMLIDKSEHISDRIALGVDLFKTSKRKTIQIWTRKSY